MADPKGEIKISKKLIVGIAVALVLALAVWQFFPNEQSSQDSETEDLIQGESESVVVIVNGEEITSDDVEAVRQSFLQRGRQISMDEAIEQTINQRLLVQRSEQEYQITNEEAESFIETQLSTRGMSVEEYKQYLEGQGISYESEIENIKSQMAVQNFVGVELEDENLEVSEQEASDFYDEYERQSTGEIPSYEELETQIVAALKQEKQAEAINSLIQELRLDADIRYS